jgi:hypothetical protein
LAPSLNIACSFVRQERFGEATREVVKLLDRGYVPWAREVLTAADLGALKVRPEMKAIQEAMAAGAMRWGSDLPDSVLFVARQRPPLRMPPTGEGVFILGLQQEIFAFTPTTGRYRQITAEDGRVLVMARSPDGRRVAYVTGEKLVRGPGGSRTLRGLALRHLDLHTMALSTPMPVDGDVTRLEIGFFAGDFVFRIAGDKLAGTFLRPSTGGPQVLVPTAPLTNRRAILAELTPQGAQAQGSAQPAPPRGVCRAIAREKRPAAGLPSVEVVVPGKKPMILRPRFGAGLAGLAMPGVPP